MIEVYGDFWEKWQDYNIVCIPTNGVVKSDGRAVMGAGIARQANAIFFGLDLMLGQKIRVRGSHVLRITAVHIGKNEISLYSFPTKSHWKETSDHCLIEASARELMARLQLLGSVKVLLARPGCGAGRLSWQTVKPMLEKILDDRVYVICYKEKNHAM